MSRRLARRSLGSILVVALVARATSALAQEAPSPPAQQAPTKPTTLPPTPPTPAEPPRDPSTGLPVVPRDPTTGLPLPLRDATGQPIVPRDETGQPIALRDATGQPIVPRDETGQPIVPRDETGQIVIEREEPPRADSLLRPLGPNGVLTLDEIEGRAREAGGVDWRSQVALVEGYNSNVEQTQMTLNGPVTRHPSPFTGVDAVGELHTWSSPTDAHSFRLQLRGQHYTPLESYHEPDDGTINGGWSGQFTLGERTVLQGRAFATLTSVNSARLDDGTLFLVDPTGLQRTYSLETARLALLHELTPRWRLVVGADFESQTTLKDAPIELPDGTEKRHRGLDYIQPGVDVTVLHDFDERNIGSARVRYAPTLIEFLVDYSHEPPLYGGHATVHMGEAEVGLTHAFTERFRSLTTVGTLLSEAPPFDPDRRPILSPVLGEELTFVKEYWLMSAGANYTYGSANPRLGFGPSIGATATAQGVPFPNGELRNFAVIVNAAANRAAFREGATELSRMSYVAGDVEVRYGVNTWLGIMAGYDARYATFEGGAAFPPLLRHIVFLGVSGYWATDRSLPTLETFVSPIRPPG